MPPWIVFSSSSQRHFWFASMVFLDGLSIMDQSWSPLNLAITELLINPSDAVLSARQPQRHSPQSETWHRMSSWVPWDRWQQGLPFWSWINWHTLDLFYGRRTLLHKSSHKPVNQPLATDPVKFIKYQINALQNIVKTTEKTASGMSMGRLKTNTAKNSSRYFASGMTRERSRW